MGGIIFVLLSYLALQHSPIQYYAYLAFPLFFWGIIYQYRSLLLSHLPMLFYKETLTLCLFTLFTLELMVYGIWDRRVFMLCLICVGLWSLFNYGQGRMSGAFTLLWFFTNCAAGVFPLLPVTSSNMTSLVIMGGILLFILGFIGGSEESRSLITVMGMLNGKEEKSELFHFFQLGTIVTATVNVYFSEASIREKEGLPLLNQIGSWGILGFFISLFILLNLVF